MTIDMAEATRLTRLGKLNEAMAVLRGEGPIEAVLDATVPQPHIEMTQAADGAWRMETDESAGSSRARRAPKPRIDLKDLVATFRETKIGRVGPAVPHGATFSEYSVRGVAGGHRFKVYVPSNYTGLPMPMTVMLHGCTQSPDDFALGTDMNALAETHGFLVLYPQQSKTANLNRCWNWFNSDDQHRDRGEPALLVGMVRQVTSDLAVDPRRIYVAGLSAGGAMAAILGARYPDIFARIGVHSGLAVGAARDMPSAFSAMSQGTDTRLETVKAFPPTFVIHGDADATVHSRNADHLVRQVLHGRKLESSITYGRSDGGRGYSRTIYTDGDGQTKVEQWVIHGAGHAWSGGKASGSYTDVRGPAASREMVRFFLDSSDGET